MTKFSFFEKRVISQLGQKFPPFIKSDYSLLSLQQPVNIASFLNQCNRVNTLTFQVFSNHSNITPYQNLDLRSGTFLSGFPTKSLCATLNPRP